MTDAAANSPERRVHVQIETREGLLLYSDDAQRENRRTLGTLTLALLLPEHPGETEVCWRVTGNLMMGLVPQLIAEYYLRNPGLREAVDGLYLLAQTLQRQRASEEGKR